MKSMKRFGILLISLVCSTALWSQQMNVTDAKGKKQGPWQKTYPKSVALEYKGQFKDDKPVGTFYYYYPSTKLKAIIKHDENSTRSACIMYHDNGVMIAQGIYRNQQKDSVWTHYGPSGRLSFKETYKGGKLNGLKTVYYVPEDPNDKSQRIARTENYVNDQLEGEFVEYFDVGGVKSKGMYQAGKPIGLLVINHPNGKPMIHERYKYGNRHGWCIAFNENGVETGRKYFKFGQELTGKQLEEWIATCKEKGRSPNE